MVGVGSAAGNPCPRRSPDSPRATPAILQESGPGPRTGWTLTGRSLLAPPATSPSLWDCTYPDAAGGSGNGTQPYFQVLLSLVWVRTGWLLPPCPQQDTCRRPRKYGEGFAPRPRGDRPVASYPGYTSENGALVADQVLILDTSKKPVISFRPREIARRNFSGTSFFLHRQNSVSRLPCGCCFAAPSRLIEAVAQKRPPAGGYPFDSGHWSCSPHAILENGGNAHLQGACSCLPVPEQSQ